MPMVLENNEPIVRVPPPPPNWETLFKERVSKEETCLKFSEQFLLFVK